MSKNGHRDEVIRIGSPDYLSFSKNVILGMVAIAIVGGLGAIGGALLYADGMQRVMLAYLVAVTFVLSISLGSLFFVLIQHLTRAGWAVLVRRPAEIFALNVITVGVLAVPIAWSAFSGAQSIYPWARSETLGASADQRAGREDAGGSVAETDRVRDFPELFPVALQSDRPRLGGDSAVHEPSHEPPPASEDSHEPHDVQSHLYVHQTFDELTASKTGWLNPPFFVARLLVYFATWGLIAVFYFRRSRHQDEAGGVEDTRQMEWWSGPAMFASGIMLTFAAYDLLMSLDPHWYSTVFGVYYFAGSAVGGFAVCLLSWLVLSRLGMVSAKLSDAHFRDLGRLLFAFVFFWGYIAFSQYMLLWYANIPETTRWLAVRGASTAEGYRNSWSILLVLLLFGHFVIPFLGLMSRHVKGNRAAMIFWTIWLLGMHYIDLYWLVMPEFRPSLAFGIPELGTMVLVGSLYLMGASYFATRTALVPVGDPRLKDSLVIDDVY